MSAREHIFDKLRRARAAAGAYEAGPDTFAEQPERDPVERYTELAIEALSTVDSVTSWDKVPAAVQGYLASRSLGSDLVSDTRAPIDAAAWKAAGLDVLDPPVEPDDDCFVTDCFGAVAESGAVVISSDDGKSIANDFLARTHIILLPKERIVSSLAELWALLRAEYVETSLPREFCLVTGPSRTADLGVPARMGAHGPERMHVIIVDV
jgi:L-lactate dehydrogenase complex protein LldG